MNERIQELAKQCYYDDNINPDGTRISDQKFIVFDKAKFAELIVRECADRVAGMVVMDKGHIPQDPHSQGWNSAVAYASKELKKYYRVE